MDDVSVSEAELVDCRLDDSPRDPVSVIDDEAKYLLCQSRSFIVAWLDYAICQANVKRFTNGTKDLKITQKISEAEELIARIDTKCNHPSI